MTTPGEKTSQMALYSTLTPAVLTDLLCIDRPNDDSYKSPLAAFRTLLLGDNADWGTDGLDITNTLTVPPANSSSAPIFISTTDVGSGTWTLQNALWGIIATDAASSSIIATLRGARLEVTHAGSGPVTNLTGQRTSIAHPGTGAVTNLSGGIFDVALSGAGNVATDVALLRLSATLSGAGTRAALYGLLVNPMAGATLNYAIKTLGGRIGFVGLPTSASGLATGDVWSNGGVLTVV